MTDNTHEDMVNDETKVWIASIFDEDASDLPFAAEYRNHLHMDMGDYNHGSNICSMANARYLYVKNSFPLLAREWASLLGVWLADKDVHELACGPGWLSHWLNKYGANIKSCSDNHSWNSEEKIHTHLSSVLKIDAVEHVMKAPDADVFIVSWPYMDDMSVNIWNAMRPGQQMLYIGEGCNAPDGFFDAVDGCEIEADWLDEVNHQYISPFGINDKIRLFEK